MPPWRVLLHPIFALIVHLHVCDSYCPALHLATRPFVATPCVTSLGQSVPWRGACLRRGGASLVNGYNMKAMAWADAGGTPGLLSYGGKDASMGEKIAVMELLSRIEAHPEGPVNSYPARKSHSAAARGYWHADASSKQHWDRSIARNGSADLRRRMRRRLTSCAPLLSPSFCGSCVRGSGTCTVMTGVCRHRMGRVLSSKGRGPCFASTMNSERRGACPTPPMRVLWTKWSWSHQAREQSLKWLGAWSGVSRATGCRSCGCRWPTSGTLLAARSPAGVSLRGRGQRPHTHTSSRARAAVSPHCPTENAALHRARQVGGLHADAFPAFERRLVSLLESGRAAGVGIAGQATLTLDLTCPESAGSGVGTIENSLMVRASSRMRCGAARRGAARRGASLSGTGAARR